MFTAAPNVSARIDRQLRSDQSLYGSSLDMLLMNPRRRVEDTISAMQAIVHDAAGHSQDVQQVATVIGAATRNRDVPAQLASLHRYMQDRINFRPDTFGTETLRHPDQLIHEIRVNGKTSCDCDDVAMFFCSIARALGVKPAFVVCAKTQGGEFVHVHPAAEVGGELCGFDPQEGFPPGQFTPCAKRRCFWA